MENETASAVTAESLMRKVEELLLSDTLSEAEKVTILQKMLSILEEEM